MTIRWVACIPLGSRDSLGAIRLEPGIEAMNMGDDIYVRGECESRTLPPHVRALPGRLFTVMADDQMIEHQRKTPTARMPIGHWAPLHQWLKVELPQAAFDAELPRPVPLTVVRSAVIHSEPNLLVATPQQWFDYVESAPEIRLRALRYTCKVSSAPSASSESPEIEHVLIHGIPLPPIAGQRWVERHGIATPAGWTWSPELDPTVVAAAFHLQVGDVILLHIDQQSERINNDQWAPSRRSSVRLSLSRETQQEP